MEIPLYIRHDVPFSLEEDQILYLDPIGGEVDASIVTTHMMLQAWELGIGSCWIGSFNPKEVSEAFDIPACEHPVAILPLGYPLEGCRPSDRHAAYRPDDEMVRYK